MPFALLILLGLLCYFVPGVLQAVQCVVYAGLAIWLVAQAKPVSIRTTIDEPVTVLILVLAVVFLVYHLAKRTKPAAPKPPS